MCRAVARACPAPGGPYFRPMVTSPTRAGGARSAHPARRARRPPKPGKGGVLYRGVAQRKSAGLQNQWLQVRVLSPLLDPGVPVVSCVENSTVDGIRCPAGKHFARRLGSTRPRGCSTTEVRRLAMAKTGVRLPVAALPSAGGHARRPFPGRLTAGHGALNAGIEVRVLAREPVPPWSAALMPTWSKGQDAGLRNLRSGFDSLRGLASGRGAGGARLAGGQEAGSSRLSVPTNGL
jgi:hypothetical protein